MTIDIFSFILAAHSFLLAGNQFIFWKELIYSISAKKCLMWNVAKFVPDEVRIFLKFFFTAKWESCWLCVFSGGLPGKGA